MSAPRSRSRPAFQPAANSADDERVLAPALLRLDAGQRQDAPGGRRRAIGERTRRRVTRRRGRRRERRQDGQRPSGAAARRVDGEVGRGAEPLDPRAVLPHVGQPLLPRLRLLRGVRLRGQPGPARFVLVDPGAEVAGRQPRKRQQQVRQVPLGVDGDGGHAVDGGFLDERRGRARSCRCRSCPRRGRGSPGGGSRRGPARPAPCPRDRSPRPR